MTDMNETNLSHALPGQERYVAPLEETPLKDVDSVDESAPASSLWADAWRTLRKNPMFIISAVLIVFIIFVALFPGVMTKQNPNYCTLENSLEPASKGHPFGFDLQGCDVYSRRGAWYSYLAERRRVRYGAGGAVGYADRCVERFLRRLGRHHSQPFDRYFPALPILLGAIVVLQMFKTNDSIWKIILVMTLFGWTSVARIARGAVMEAKNLEFNTASTALGSTPGVTCSATFCRIPWHRSLWWHNVSGYIHRVGSNLELPWCGSADHYRQLGWRHLQCAVHSAYRSDGAVLPVRGTCHHCACFIMMGDAVKDALDPKSRT